MSNIKPLDLSLADHKTAETLAAVKRKLGMVPNLFATLAHAPAALTGYLQLSEALATGRLTARQRELIAITVAQENACGYCLSAHTAIGKSVGLQAADLHKAREGHAVDAKDEAVVAFAQRVNRSRGAVGAADLDTLRAAGIDDGLIIEIIVNVALNVLTNYVNVVAATEIDFPKVDLKLAG